MAGNTDSTLLLEALRGVLTQVAEPTVVLRTTLDQAVARTGAERGLLVEVTQGGEMDFQVLHQFTSQDLAGSKGEFSRGILNRVKTSGRGMIYDDAQADVAVGRAKSVAALRLVSVLCEPIVIDGSVAAIVHL